MEKACDYGLAADHLLAYLSLFFLGNLLTLEIYDFFRGWDFLHRQRKSPVATFFHQMFISWMGPHAQQSAHRQTATQYSH